MTDDGPGDRPYGRRLGGILPIWMDRLSGGVAKVRVRRYEALLAHARAHSPYYRRLFADVPAGAVPLADLPVTSKADLMAHFDDWATDRDITRQRVDAFVADRSLVGTRFLGRYVVWKSSGTTGEPGIYVQDDRALEVYDALVAVQLAAPDLVSACIAGSLLQGGRAALIAATGDHFASVASWERASRGRAAARCFSVMEPVDALVAAIAAFRPAFVASYPTVLRLLADERVRGRLRIDPALAWSGGEHLGEQAHQALERDLGCRVLNEYGASECLSIGFGCREQWLHVHADWVIVEPVDEAMRPTPPGARSHTLLLTNLANHVQPIVRYDLGDSVLVHPGRCACGNPLPAIRVDGRRDDIVTLCEGEREVRILPMALTTVFEEASGAHRFQIVQRSPRRLLVRLAHDEQPRFADGARALRDYLAAQGLASVAVTLDRLAPVPDTPSGKLRQVIVDRAVRAERA